MMRRNAPPKSCRHRYGCAQFVSIMPLRHEIARPTFKRMIVQHLLPCLVAVFFLFEPLQLNAWARNANEPTFTIGKALNVELFLNLTQSQNAGQLVTSGYNLKPQNYRPLDPQEIKAAGFDAVRLAVDPVPLLNSTESERLAIYPMFAKFIDKLIAVDLNVIFDLHVTSRDPVWNQDTLAKSVSDQKFKLYKNVAVSVAQFLAAYDPQHVALELFNEPPCISASQWSEIQKALYIAVRNVIPNHTLILTGPCWSSIDGLQTIEPSDYDRNTLFTFHFYEPTIFTFQGIPWLKGGFKFMRRLPYPPAANRSNEFIAAMEADVKRASDLDAESKSRTTTYLSREIRHYFEAPMNRDWLKVRLSAAQNWAKRVAISPHRIFAGEFGADRDFDDYLAASGEDRMHWLHDVRTLFEMAGFSWGVWSDCCAFGILAGPNGPFDPAALNALGLLGSNRSAIGQTGKRSGAKP